MLRKLLSLIDVLRTEGGWQSLTKWRPRSLASFRLLRSIQDEGVAFRTVIDGGANVGQFARATSWAFPEAKVYSFEPLPDIAAKLRENLADVSQLQVFEMALGNQDGEIEINRSRDPQASSILSQRAYQGSKLEGAAEIGKLTVPVRRLDTVLDDLPVPGPVLLKLDLQGYELEALKGAAETLKKSSHVLVEAVFEETYVDEPLFEELWLHLREAGFRFVRPLTFLADMRGHIVQLDALFAANSQQINPSSAHHVSAHA